MVKRILRYLLNQFDKTFSPLWTLMLLLLFTTTANAQLILKGSGHTSGFIRFPDSCDNSYDGISNTKRPRTFYKGTSITDSLGQMWKINENANSNLDSTYEIGRLTTQPKRNDVALYILQFISGSADGVNQAVTHHHLGQGNKFWDQDSSWRNKYRNWPEDKRAAFPGSKSLLVFATDAYHLTRFIDRSAMTASIVLAINNVKSWKVAVKKAIILTIINRIGFGLFYNLIFKK